MTQSLSPAELLTTKSRPLSAGEGLSAEATADQLTRLPHWRLDGDAITRTFTFHDYYETMAFVNALAFVVHAEDHHPDLAVSYNRVVVRFNTHSTGGISLNDFIGAAHADALYEKRPRATA